jgi:hypothetical protein
MKDYFTRGVGNGASGGKAFTAEYAEIAEKTILYFLTASALQLQACTVRSPKT